MQHPFTVRADPLCRWELGSEIGYSVVVWWTGPDGMWRSVWAAGPSLQEATDRGVAAAVAGYRTLSRGGSG